MQRKANAFVPFSSLVRLPGQRLFAHSLNAVQLCLLWQRIFIISAASTRLIKNKAATTTKIIELVTLTNRTVLVPQRNRILTVSVSTVLSRRNAVMAYGTVTVGYNTVKVRYGTVKVRYG